MRLILAYPVSANRYWRTVVNPRTGRAMTFVSPEAKEYKRHIARCADEAKFRPATGAVELHARLIPANGVCMDLDNALKVTIDALKGVAYEDDSQVYRIVAERCEPDAAGARLEVDVNAWAPPSPLFP